MFEGRNPEGQDFHGIKQLLQQLFLKAHIDLSQLSDMLINQVGIGSVLKQGFSDSDDEDETEMADQSDVFGITSVINLGLHKVSLLDNFVLVGNKLLKYSLSWCSDFMFKITNAFTCDSQFAMYSIPRVCQLCQFLYLIYIFIKL